jgi:hypothetical protein
MIIGGYYKNISQKMDFWDKMKFNKNATLKKRPTKSNFLNSIEIKYFN